MSLEDQIVSTEQRLRAERDEARRQTEQLARALEALERRYDLVTAIDGLKANPPAWLTPKKSIKGHRGIANTISSDQHYGETVNPAEIANTNAYNIEIAKMRWKRHVDKFISLGLDQLGYLNYDGAHVWWNGDAFSGDIHEELAKTNRPTSTLACMDEMLDPVIAGLRAIRDAYGRLHISVRRGNHTRTSRKTPAKGRVKESYDWLFMRIVEREFRGDSMVTFDIPESDDGIIEQYGTKYLATHGDQFRGGSGISGILTPLSLGNYRKARRQMSVGQPYDVMILGHFHQYMTIPGIIVNGSAKGYDEYAYTSNFGFEEPIQAFWVTTPEHGPSFHTPIMVADQESEGW